jgi:hypothetical protein
MQTVSLPGLADEGVDIGCATKHRHQGSPL